MTDKTKPRMRIYQDEVKLRHTPHWDLDTMSREDFEACMSGRLDPPNPTRPPQANPLPQAHMCGMSTTPPTLWERFLRACLPKHH